MRRVISLVNLAEETCHGFESMLCIKCSCCHGKVDAEENNLEFYILCLNLSLIWLVSMLRIQGPLK